MKYLLLFMFCISLSSFETSSHYVQNQVVLSNNNTITREKLSYKQRVMVKYLKLKARIVKHKTTVAVIVGAFFLVLGIGFIRISNTKKGCLGGLLEALIGLASLCISLIAFIIALVTSL